MYSVLRVFGPFDDLAICVDRISKLKEGLNPAINRRGHLVVDLSKKEDTIQHSEDLKIALSKLLPFLSELDTKTFRIVVDTSISAPQVEPNSTGVRFNLAVYNAEILDLLRDCGGSIEVTVWES